MPDLITVFSKWWKFIIGITLLSAIIAYVVSILSPKEFLSEATALPANSMIADKARIFNKNIEALYSDIGTPDELDRLEGTGTLDTLYIAASDSFQLGSHYGYGEGGESAFKAARKLKKNSKIARSAFGELKVKVWDEDRNLAASLANFLMARLQSIHQHMQNETSLVILERMRADYAAKQQQFTNFNDSTSNPQVRNARHDALLSQIGEYEKMISEYQLAINTNPPVLLTVEPARASLWADKPRTFQTMAFTIVVALGLTFLVALYMESRKR
jgi:hypothetical protein